MKKLLSITICIMLMGILINISCKKDMTCENCGTNLPGGIGIINKSPVANAGPDLVITLPTGSVLLDGNASSDPDGNINAGAWRKISGPASVTIII